MIKELKCGDCTIVDSGDLGFDVLDRDGNKVFWINRIGEAMLLEWLKLKNQEVKPDWLQSNVERVMKERGFPDDFHC